MNINAQGRTSNRCEMIRPKIIRPEVIRPNFAQKITRPSLSKSYKTEFCSKITRPNQKD